MVKLTDLDDMDGKPKTCKSRNDCLIGGERWNTSVPCTKGRCENYNAKSNLYHLYRTFLDYTLDFENPQGAEHDLKGIAEKIRNFTVNAKELLQELLLVVNNIKMGKYAIRYRKEGKLEFFLFLITVSCYAFESTYSTFCYFENKQRIPLYIRKFKLNIGKFK